MEFCGRCTTVMPNRIARQRLSVVCGWLGELKRVDRSGGRGAGCGWVRHGEIMDAGRGMDILISHGPDAVEHLLSSPPAAGKASDGSTCRTATLPRSSARARPLLLAQTMRLCLTRHTPTTNTLQTSTRASPPCATALLATQAPVSLPSASAFDLSLGWGLKFLEGKSGPGNV